MGRMTIYNAEITQSWDSVSEENKTLYRDFIRYCQSTNKSPQTLTQYKEWLKIFFCWNYDENNDKFFIDLKKRDFVYYFGWLQDKGMSANRVAALKSVLSSFASEIELLDEDLYPNFRNQLRGLEPIHIDTVREKTVLSPDKLEQILQNLVDSKCYQEACYLALVCASGARKAELLQMKVSFFTRETEAFNGYMYVTPLIRSKGRGKEGKKIKKYVIKEMFLPYLTLWLEQREKQNIKSEWLFVTKKGDQYIQATISTANSFAQKISKLNDTDFYAHSGRHYFCSLLRSMNLPDEAIRLIFSWESANLIQIYDDTPVDDRLAKWFIKQEKEGIEGE